MSGRRRPAARQPGLRRPAAAVEPRDQDPSSRFHRGEVVAGAECPPGLIGSGDWLKATEATYFEKPCEFAGVVERVVIEKGETEVVLKLTGTSCEELLRFATGLSPPTIRAHLCGEGCDQKRSNADLVQVRKFKRILPGDEKTWEENLKESDENVELRKKQAEWEAQRREEEQRQRESSDSRAESKKKKKMKKKKKERARAKPAERPKRSKVGGKAQARKSLQVVFEGTGLDPDPKVRKKLKRQVRKKLKRAKSSSGSSSSHSSSSSASGDFEPSLLEDRNKVQKLAELAPGLLSEGALQQMKTYVTQASGSMWSMDEDSLPPLLTQDVRHHVAPKTSGGILREATSLAYIGDLLLQGRVAEGLDALNQRLKSLELVIAGQPWATAQKIEIVPSLDASMATRAEIQVAQKEAKLDSQTKGSGSTWEKGKSKGKSKDKDKGKDKGKGGKLRDEGKKSS